MKRPSTAAALRPAALALALVLGCGRGEPDDLFFIFGRTVDHQGTPLPGTELVLSRTESTGCSDNLRLNIFDGPAAAYQDYKTATAVETGEYLFEMMRFELEVPGFSTRCMRLRHEGQGGTFSVFQTYAIPDDVEVPDLAIWSGQAPTLTTGASGLEARLTPLPWEPTPPEAFSVEPGVEPPEQVRFYDWVIERDGQLAWHQQTADGTLVVTPELREDFGAAVALDAMTLHNGPSSGPFGGAWAFFRGIFRSAPAGPLPAGRVPVSRGASCTFRDVPLAGCPLTDGLLGLHALQPVPGPDPGPPPATPDRISLRLSAPVQPTLLIARELHTFYSMRELLVEGSEDGVAWIELGRITPEDAPREQGYALYQSFLGTGQHVRIPLDSQGRPIQHVRLEAVGGSRFFAIRELSVFD